MRVADEHHLLIPDRPGNNRLDTFGNIRETGKVGLLFIVPGLSHSLRVNGTAHVVVDRPTLETMTANGKLPLAGLLVTVQEAFFHCGKAMIRSGLWDPERALPKSSFPGIGRIIAEQLGEGDPSESERRVDEEALRTLY